MNGFISERAYKRIAADTRSDYVDGYRSFHTGWEKLHTVGFDEYVLDIFFRGIVSTRIFVCQRLRGWKQSSGWWYSSAYPHCNFRSAEEAKMFTEDLMALAFSQYILPTGAKTCMTKNMDET